MKIERLKRRAAAFGLGITLAVTQVLTWRPATIQVHAETSQTSGGQAMLLYLDGDSNLGDAMPGDARALKAILANTNEFDESGIQTYGIAQNSDTDYKEELWKRIDDMAENTDENSFTVFTYSGHGNAALDGTSYLALGGVNNITAAELRSHLDKLHGRVLVIISCCYSGGMIMPADLYDDEVQESQGSFSGEDFTEAFLSYSSSEEQETAKVTDEKKQTSEEKETVKAAEADKEKQTTEEKQASEEKEAVKATEADEEKQTSEEKATVKATEAEEVKQASEEKEAVKATETDEEKKASEEKETVKATESDEEKQVSKEKEAVKATEADEEKQTSEEKATVKTTEADEEKQASEEKEAVKATETDKEKQTSEEKETAKTTESNDENQSIEEKKTVITASTDSGKQSSEEKITEKKTTEEKTTEEKTSTTTSTTTTNPPKYYFITAANQWETSYSQSDIGTELVSTFGHAMGYDRNNGEYHTFGADVSSLDESRKWEGYAGDGKITMRELATYYKSGCALTSTPTIYPMDSDNSDDVLFTYGSNAGHPATFLADLSSENVSVNAEGTIKVTPIIQNLTDKDITLKAGVYDFAPRTFVFTTASSGKYMDGEEMSDVYAAESGETQEHVIPANACVSDVTFTFTADRFRDNTTDRSKNPFCIKIWEKVGDGDRIGSYRALSFFTVPEDGKKDTIDASAFALKKPAQLTAQNGATSDTVTKTSSRLPIEIIYDYEYGDKYSGANCRLSLYCYDFGAEFPSGFQTKKDAEGYSDVLVDSDLEEVGLNDYTKKVVFESVVPTKERTVEEYSTWRGGIHSYVMDTSGLTEGHYYVLQFICHDESTGKDKSIFALIQRTGAQEAEEYQIPFFKLTNDVFDAFRCANGIPIGENWTENYSRDQLTVKASGQRLKEAIQDAAGNNYDIQITNWKKQEADGSGENWEDMQENERFSPGQKYLCTIEISVKEGSSAVFTNTTNFVLNRHGFQSVEISEDKKTASLTIVHTIPSETFLKSMKLEMYRTDGKSVGEKVEADDTSLHPGDKVVLVYENDLIFNNLKGIKDTGSTVTYNGSSYTVYEITELEKGAEKEDILFTVWKDGENNCACGQTLYKWTVYAKEDGGKDTPSGGDTSGDSSSGGSSGSSSGGSGSTGSDSSSSSGGSSSAGSDSSSSSGGSSSTGSDSSSSGSDSGSSGSGSGSSGGSSESDTKGENASAGSGASDNSRKTVTPGGNKTTDGGQNITVTAQSLATGEGSAAVIAADTAGNAGTSQMAKTGTVTGGTGGMDTNEQGIKDETSESGRDGENVKEETVQGKTDTEKPERSDSDPFFSEEDNADEKTQKSDDTANGSMLWLYLILIWLLAVLLGIAIYRHMKKRRS